MTWRLWQVTAPRFCAGIMTDGEKVVGAAPVLKWAIGKTRGELRGYFKRKGWKIRNIPLGKR